MELFKEGKFYSHSGLELDYKIECDALTDIDLGTLAGLISSKLTYGKIIGIPTGGNRLANILRSYNYPMLAENPNTILLVDDVMTTGASMEEYRTLFKISYIVKGVVIFDRSEKGLQWVTSIFKVNLQ